MAQKPLLVLFDAHALIHRAFHAIPALSLKTGEPTGAVFGFASMLLKSLSDLKPTHVAVCFDSAGPTFRHELYEEYKAHRPKAPDELISQFATVRELVSTFNIPSFELAGYEADDLLGTLSRQAEEREIDTIIVTSDTDTLQLVAPHVRVMMPRQGRSFNDTIIYDETAVEERYSLAPEQIADLKGLEGDPSDNIKGVPGVGEKTATRLISQFGSVEGIYENLDEVSPPRIQQKLAENREAAFLSKDLTTIATDAPIQLDMDACLLHSYSRQDVVELFHKLEFNSLIGKLPQTSGEKIETVMAKASGSGDYRLVDSEKKLDELLSELRKAGEFAFDTETTGLDAMQAQLVGLSFATTSNAAHYIPVGHGSGTQLAVDGVLNRLRPLFENPDKAKIAHNGKYDMTILANCGIHVENLAFDTMIAAYLLGEKSLGLKSLALAKLGIEMTPITDLIGIGSKQLSMDQVDIAEASKYACADADVTLQLYHLLAPRLEQEGLMRLFAEVEMPLVPVLLSMEMSGVKLNGDYLTALSQQMQQQIYDIEAQIYNSIGHQFNVNSPQQLAGVLFDELGLPASKRRSTDARVLEELKGHHPIVDLMLQYRQLAKVKSTYVDALPSLISPETGRIHTSFNQTQTATGRLSSSRPNLQNIPVGKQIRQAFVPDRDCLFLSADYSQIELRIMAHLSQDEGLMSAFINDEDIHTQTASEVFEVAREEVTPDMRRIAKVINFGVLYGMSSYGLEQATALSRQEAGKFIETYFDRFSGVKAFTKSTIAEAKEKGYAQTILGRRRYIPGINSSNYQARSEAQRMAINMPVQGTASDIIKVAMIRIQRRIDELGLKSKMILQVHDELVFEVPRSELMELRGIVYDIMPSAITLCVPVKVDIKIGENWGEMEKS